jgi:hypothetical protein
MTPFDAHGIDHLSASSLNLWMANPREWAVRFLAGQTDEADPAMWRGSAVEAGLAQLLHGRLSSLHRSAVRLWQMQSPPRSRIPSTTSGR